MSLPNFSHQPVLFQQVIDLMNIKSDGIYIDGTFGRGGHAAAILAQLNENGRLLVMDKDPEAIAHAKKQYADDARVTIIHDDYSQMAERIEQLGLKQLVDGVLLDLGVSSPQLDDAERGFSFQKNGPLDMRMNPQQGISAAEWLMTAQEKEIADVLWQLGEERFSRRIAKKIIEFRQQQAITDTATLVSIISDCVPAHKEKKHPATRSFQAIRMKVNQELDHIHQVLDGIFDVLNIGGRLLVISFHSLEDRLIKRFFKKHSTPPVLPRGLPVRDSDIRVSVRFRNIGKAVKATAEEIKQNTRSRSAILRIAERVS
ncbi:MAG: 16S rRNA (cytosine(1402)-N(4))-methyltransferase RsmH [Gammaproteobacteria bacterium]|nr:16S rRNA (cytosine(1402)-N(4))-methyltransferase RsmH [Gammaproteobacteria bacterium]